MMQEKITKKEKMTAQDMVNFMHDVLDVIARRQMPVISKIARDTKK